MAIYEPGLQERTQKNIKFTTDLATGQDKALYCFIAVGTPAGQDGIADLSNVLKAAHSIASLLEKYTVIVNKSTVLVGAADLIETVKLDLARIVRIAGRK